MKSPAYTYAAAGAFDVKLTVTDDMGARQCTSPTARSRLRSPGNTNPTANFTFSCTGLDCTFTDGSSDADAGDAVASWAWNFGEPASGTNTSTLQNPSHSYTAQQPRRRNR